MELKFITSLFIYSFILQSCSTTKNSIFWVSGIKTECSSGAGKMNCLKIHRGQDLHPPKWENFYANIDGFKFKEGVLTKIEVREQKLDKKDVPMGGLSIQYTLVKKLEVRTDERIKFKEDWTLVKLNDNPVNRMVILPTMKISLNQMQVNGSGGCNVYSGPIEKLTSSSIKFGNIASSMRACISQNIEGKYYNALNSVDTYTFEQDYLTFFNKEGKKVLTFMKQQPTEANQRLHDIWNAVSIYGESTNRKNRIPRLEINLVKMHLFGNDGCNEYNGKINNASATELSFGKIASTKKMCLEMNITNNFNKAINEVASYKLDGLKLLLLDENGLEVLTFLKGD